MEEMQNKNKKYHEQLSKKDFFREYDYMNREVRICLIFFGLLGLGGWIENAE